MKFYVCVDVDGNMQGVDMPSGGYPFKTNDLNGVRFWLTKEKALDYAKSFAFDVKELTFTLKDV